LDRVTTVGDFSLAVAKESISPEASPYGYPGWLKWGFPEIDVFRKNFLGKGSTFSQGSDYTEGSKGKDSHEQRSPTWTVIV
jgi:hypothetical protein